VWESQIPINKIINAKDAAKTMKCRHWWIISDNNDTNLNDCWILKKMSLLLKCMIL
jgi:hypothetical protein